MACSLLSACLGGSIAQQIASSIATHAADNAMANAMDVQDGPSHAKPQNIVLKDTEPDDVWVAMATAGFDKVDPNTPLNEPPSAEEPVATAQTNSLVRVELFNMLIGEERKAVFEKARLVGALNLPNPKEWPRWNVATGVVESDKRTITFLVPPEFGKLPSGTVTVVELASPGNLNIARYKSN